MTRHPRAIACVLAVLAPAIAHAASLESIAGHWEGAYSRLGSIQTVMFDFTLEGGVLEGTYDLPEWDLYGEPIEDLQVDLPRLVLHPKYGLFTMIVHPDLGEMTGENRAWNPPLALHLKRRATGPRSAPARESITLRSGSVTLEGTLVRPPGSDPAPAIVIVHGSGAQDRADAWYRFWGDFFARRGIASLVYDKRGVGASTGDHSVASFEDLASDAVGWVDLLRDRPGILRERIGLMGISQGGWIAPLAASLSEGVRFLILIVGPAVSVAEQEMDRVEHTMRAEGFPEDPIREALAYTRRVFEAAYGESSAKDLEAETAACREKPWSRHVPIVESDRDLEDWRRIRYDPEPVLRRTTIPVLAIFGEHDALVPPQKNSDRMERALRAGGNRDVTVRVIPGVGHDMITEASLLEGQWRWPEGFWVWPRRPPAFHEAIETWLEDHPLGVGADGRDQVREASGEAGVRSR